ncbi:methyltransferase TYW3-domain-containing protein [Xylariomycetidae sp. FL2044]|nr:methyltransferase TYW3-domain-containing protein [Xylariomycetidae sp. FL2044]KAH9883662.1 methyltransferase TYW3-domain-containing protein [Xylariomycetidae sp. FL2044]
MTPPLPQPPLAFQRRKSKILQQLAVPDAQYTDASPKGSVDEGIRDLIAEINGLDGLVTTSSCAGRVSVFVEGRKGDGLQNERGDGGDKDEDEGAGRVPTTKAGVGGKGGGGSWLFVSHEPIPRDHELGRLLGMGRGTGQAGSEKGLESQGTRLIHFKFEPMILHILTASAEHAQLLIRSGLEAGFRESGAINLTGASEPAMPIVAIRSMGLALESLLGAQAGDDVRCTVSEEYLRVLVQIANERFVENRKRIERFRRAILEMTGAVAAEKGRKMKEDGSAWEDKSARWRRKREEGLRRKDEAKKVKENYDNAKEDVTMI